MPKRKPEPKGKKEPPVERRDVPTAEHRERRDVPRPTHQDPRPKAR